ncbi:hypothetical protein [Yeguia hominis]|uniref:CYTH domain-containing protein n=1 Tax=Yeguia hominis TaxID=2763662 RepID=A0A926DAI9_9FIRM|nr:hypothetical protein [Yeguia hominis]MBC8533819.1 hypothetical protein [Yeguia hominis]
MEIERKFLISGFPEQFPEVRRAILEQGYLAVDPVVRIRKTTPNEGDASYKLCFKGEGTLVRQETELAISAQVFQELCALLKKPLLRKAFRTYLLPDGHTLECNCVFLPGNQVFWYAEVEFQSVEEAAVFSPPDCLLQEVTEDPSFTMRAIWERMNHQ